MVSLAGKTRPRSSAPDWHEVFLRLAPAIAAYAKVAFRDLRAEARAEAVQNALCCACAAVARLAELNKLDLCYPTVLGRYAVAQTRDGRMLGRPLNCRDVAARYCQRAKGVVMERLDTYDADEDSWQEIIIEDRHVGPADVVRVRLDFNDWLKTLSRRNRRVAQFLAIGNRTRDAAKKFGVCEGRISQVRRELQRAWDEFTGESNLHVPATCQA